MGIQNSEFRIQNCGARDLFPRWSVFARSSSSPTRPFSHSPTLPLPHSPTLALLSALLALVLLAGCIERTMVIESEPPGAFVRVDGDDCGTAPAVVPFTAYGKREVYLHRKDYFSRSEIIRVSPPAYAVFPLDFVFDVLWPFTIRDEQTFKFTLQPTEMGDLKALETRANEFIGQARALVEKERAKRGLSAPALKDGKSASVAP